jgi:hypothetical protein
VSKSERLLRNRTRINFRGGLWLGDRNEPGPGPVLKDLQLMMIGPAWLLSALYRRLGIPF